VQQSKPFGVILAGGRSRRMGGTNKALQDLSGRPLLDHVISRMLPQCSGLCLSVERVDDCWETFGLPQVVDTQPGSNGPLGGLLAALEYTLGRANRLLLVPCDAPFLPLDLAQGLADETENIDQNVSVSLVSYQGQWQPTFSLWHTDVLPSLGSAVKERNMKGLKEFIHSVPHAVVSWEEQEVSPFFNINTPADLSAAAEVLGKE
jgi:molybdopterin-guanine dinucleotide biosynthesis protein A